MQKQSHKSLSGLSYKGIPIHAAAGLHEAVVEKIQESNPQGGNHILELGCGSGGLTQRLEDNGFQVRAVDLSLDSFAAKAEAVELDLNRDFAENLDERNYDLILAIEIIEHLENPQHFLRQIVKLMSSDTRLWISFPNMYLYMNAWKFPRDNTVICWDKYHYWEMGHQTILPAWLFEQHLTKVGLSVASRYFVAPIDLIDAHGNSFVRLLSRSIMELLALLIPSVSRQQRMATCVLYEIKPT